MSKVIRPEKVFNPYRPDAIDVIDDALLRQLTPEEAVPSELPFVYDWTGGGDEIVPQTVFLPPKIVFQADELAAAKGPAPPEGDWSPLPDVFTELIRNYGDSVEFWLNGDTTRSSGTETAKIPQKVSPKETLRPTKPKSDRMRAKAAQIQLKRRKLTPFRMKLSVIDELSNEQ